MNDRIETERLSLRWLTLDDADFMLRIWNDPAFVRFVGDRGLRTTEDARQALEEGVLQTYADFGYGAYIVSLKENDALIGTCGLYRRKEFNDPDIGFALLPDFCGRGLAYEAAVAVRDFARNNLGLRRISAIVSPENAPSIGLIEKLGLSFENNVRLNGDDEDVSIYAIEWHGE